MDKDTHFKAIAEERRHWHLDKTINISHIIATVAIAAGVFTWANALEKKLDQTAQTVVYLTERQKEDKGEVKNLRSEIREDLKDINGKLDRLLESKK